jgi:hypothetical protein
VAQVAAYELDPGQSEFSASITVRAVFQRKVTESGSTRIMRALVMAVRET